MAAKRGSGAALTYARLSRTTSAVNCWAVRLRHIHHDWLDAAERTQATVRQLSDQLRRFLDDQVWFENRRVIDVLRSIEASAFAAPRSAKHPGDNGTRRAVACDPPSDGAPAVRA